MFGTVSFILWILSFPPGTVNADSGAEHII